MTTNPRLVFVMGKGGVGRSTVSAAMGLALARRGLRTLVIETSSRSVVGEMFGHGPAQYDPTEVRPRLFCCRVTWQECLREYALMKLKFQTLYRLAFENPFVQGLLPTVPGVPEILVIGKVIYCATDGVKGLGPLDVVVVDAPATGHGLSMVSVPFVVSETIAKGPLLADAQRLRTILLDRAFTRFHIVVTPEEMPVAEAIELYRELQSRYSLPLGAVIANAVQVHSLKDHEREQARLIATSRTAPPGVVAAAQAALFMDSKHRAEMTHLSRLKALLPVVWLPEAFGKGRLDQLADHIEARLWRDA